ncbi:Hypothetical protein NTJ_14325 [Nesidiocoris tenuis]|uniref:Uncharacterized protein n=1 Tax=Nesidiocoris tenuis TaxID=355587 RepID=A0ABN7BB08_9HEMI|nr:Hypothetical protein NTJ_14325 [Nesidiocoris tenuis]
MWFKIVALLVVVAGAIPSSDGQRGPWPPISSAARSLRKFVKPRHHREVFNDRVLDDRLRHELREKIGHLLTEELRTKNTQIVTEMSFVRLEADLRPRSVEVTADVLVRVSDSNCRRRRGIAGRQERGRIGARKSEDHEHSEHSDHEKHSKYDSHHSKHSKHSGHCRATHKHEQECYLTVRKHESHHHMNLLPHNQALYSILGVNCRSRRDSDESEEHDDSHHSKHHSEHGGKGHKHKSQSGAEEHGKTKKQHAESQRREQGKAKRHVGKDGGTKSVHADRKHQMSFNCGFIIFPGC